jgi:hypothetical protein
MNWVVEKYYYIINFRYWDRPRIYPVYFTSKKAAQRAIRQNVRQRKQREYYEVIKGKKLMDFKCTYVLKLGKLGQFTKYAYGEHLKTYQERKSYRTLMRRRLRRMGMLTLARNKFKVNEQPQIVKLINNTQTVANSPNTLARGFQLERKNPRYYFLILNKKISQKKGILFELRVLRIDKKTQTLKRMGLQIKRKDIITPYLLTELMDIYENHGYLLDRYRKGLAKESKRREKTIP